MQLLLGVFVTLVGLAIGSFVNVCIYRLPRDMSLLYPPSHCPNCGNRIKFYDNIPIVSYIILRGRCRYCKVRIPFRYFLVEFLTGILFLLTYLRFGLTLESLRILIFITFAECIAFIDAEHMLVPDKITFPAIVAGILLALYPGGFSFVTGIIGAAFGGIVMVLFRIGGKMIFNREALGDGDVVIMIMVGIFTGPLGVFVSILLGSLIGSIIGIFLILKNKTDILPFGPFLIFGSYIYIYIIQFTKYLTIG